MCGSFKQVFVVDVNHYLMFSPDFWKDIDFNKRHSKNQSKCWKIHSHSINLWKPRDRYGNKSQSYTLICISIQTMWCGITETCRIEQLEKKNGFSSKSFRHITWPERQTKNHIIYAWMHTKSIASISKNSNADKISPSFLFASVRSFW